VSEAASDCLFCKIIAGEIPANVAAETERSFAFFDISPGAPLHVLVVPRAHVADAAALDASHGELLADLVALANRVAEDGGVAEGGYRLVFNVGEAAGNSVGHLHLHVLGGRILAWPPG
jgi:histidine triad (HIT) family protein